MGARAHERNGAVDAAAHRHRDAAGIRLRTKHLAERVGEGVRGKRLARHGRSLEQGQAGERALEPVCVCVDDPVSLYRQPDERYLAVARRIPNDLDHELRLAACSATRNILPRVTKEHSPFPVPEAFARERRLKRLAGLCPGSANPGLR